MKVMLATAIPLLLLAAALGAQSTGALRILDVKNPAYRGNEIFRAFENFYSPRVKELRERYELDKVVAGETDEFRRILLLRHWIFSTIRVDNEHPTPTRGDAFAILDAAMKGGGFHCAHFSIVQHAVLNSLRLRHPPARLRPGSQRARRGRPPRRQRGLGEQVLQVDDHRRQVRHPLREGRGAAVGARDPRRGLERRRQVGRRAVQGVDRKPIVPKPDDPSWETTLRRPTAGAVGRRAPTTSPRSRRR